MRYLQKWMLMESCVWRSTDAPATAEDAVLGETPEWKKTCCKVDAGVLPGGDVAVSIG
jgi:hypothetical protein